MSSLPATRPGRGGNGSIITDGSTTYSRINGTSIQSGLSIAPSGYALSDESDSLASGGGRRGLTGYAESETGSQQSAGSDVPNYQNDDSDKPSWTSDKLMHTLDQPLLEKPPVKRYGGPQVLLAAVTVLVTAVVFITSVVSKLSFMTLAFKFQFSRQMRSEHDSERQRQTAHAALLLMLMTVMIPSALGMLQSMWSSCYKARRNNPMPSTTSIMYIAVTALLESGGMSIYVMLVVPNVPTVLCLTIMNGVFAVPALIRCLSSKAVKKNTSLEAAPLLNPDNPTIEELDMSSQIGTFEKGALWIACVVQFGALIYVPVFMSMTTMKDGDSGGTTTVDGEIAALAACAMIMISLAWLPTLQARTAIPTDPNHPMSARIMAGIISNFLKLGFTMCWVAALIQKEDQYSLADLDSGFRAIRHSDLLTDFLLHVFASHIAYHVAGMACAMSIQPFGFALPLVLATPMTIAMVMSSCKPGESKAELFIFEFECLEQQTDQFLLVAIALTLWVSQNIIVARNAWNSRSPLLALDEILFYQASYNSVLVEQYLLLNRREPDAYAEVVDEDPDDPSIRVYICSTMYREAAYEMKQLIASVLKVDASVRNVFEWHVFLDGGCSGNQLGQHAIQLVACLKEEIEALGVVNAEAWIESGQKMETPYGQRLEWLLPCGTPMAVHLKDPGLVKSKKRWSQVMYMYYLLQFRVPREHPRDTSASYILTTDADIMFNPEDVQALVVLLSRDKRVGACCGRTFAKGSGPIYWYQIFDYAVGHWFQKTAEHVLGTVLCCPGCFSLYRIDALRDCLLQYSSGVNEAFDFLTKDMGEDRWLCTLLVMAGWRLDYSAVASNTTFVPESFDEFFNQRRRWIVSTLANQIELLSNWRVAVRMNDSVSITFVLYQGAMVFSSLVSPATTVLVVMGGIKYSLTDSMLSDIMTWLLSAVCLYCVLLLVVSKPHQLLISKVYTALFAVLMGSVVVGVATQISDEYHLDCDDTDANVSTTTTMPGTIDDCAAGVLGTLSVTSIYLFGMVALFIAAAAVHPSEALDLLQGIWYLLCLPAGYLVLTIFAFVNLDDRSWGTRAVASTKTRETPTEWLKTLLRGCGIWHDEGVMHFLGRIISCRCHQPPPEEAAPHPYMVMAETEETTIDQKTWRLSEDGSKARCEPVDALLDYIAEHEDDADLAPFTAALSAKTAAALHACPSLANWGQWTRCWHEASHSFKMPRGNGSVAEKKFWQQMASEISGHMAQTYSWSVATKQEDFQLPDGHKKIGAWLEDAGLADAYMLRIFADHGYDDTTFIVELTEDDLRDLGMPSTLTGRAHIRKFVEAVRRLPKNTLPDSIPPTIVEWLDTLCLGYYASNFQRCGYADTDLALLEGIVLADLEQMGISKRAHLEKLLRAVDRLTKLLIQGRSPEGKSMALITTGEIRDLVSRLPEASIEATLFFPRLVLGDEESFWKQLTASKLDPKHESISNVGGLKQKLSSLRNVAIIVLFLINAIWILVMVELAQATSESLNVFGTNPLGFLFLLVYGSIFFVQFLALLWHRVATAVQYVASIPFPAQDSADGLNHRYAEIRPQ